MKTKRLFFGVSVDAPWSEPFPKGRLLKAQHITLAFLGNIEYEKVQSALQGLPLPTYKVGPVGIADELLFLPPNHSRVAASHVSWPEGESSIASYQHTLATYLRSLAYQIDHRPFLPHVTLARMPFDEKEWSKWFEKVPIATGSLHLYESLGNMVYKPIWTYFIKPGFEEIEHTADAAFIVRGTSLNMLLWHAFAALANRFPPILHCPPLKQEASSLDEIIAALNAQIAEADQKIGCPYKAVSWHGNIVEQDGILEWEMIVDV